MPYTATAPIRVIDGEVAGPVTTRIPTCLSEPLLPAPLARTRYVHRSYLARLVALVAAALASVLHPETANPKPHAGFAVGTTLACCFVVSYALAQVLSGGAQ